MSSLVVFSINVGRLAVFYESVLGAERRIEPSGDIRLLNDRDEVLVHSIPKQIGKDIATSSPPAPRENPPLKPVFDVTSLEAALESVETTGGVVTSRTFSMDGLTRHDVIDPDGNDIQLRCRTHDQLRHADGWLAKAPQTEGPLPLYGSQSSASNDVWAATTALPCGALAEADGRCPMDKADR